MVLACLGHRKQSRRFHPPRAVQRLCAVSGVFCVSCSTLPRRRFLKTFPLSGDTGGTGRRKSFGSLQDFSEAPRPVLSQDGGARKQNDAMCTMRKATSLLSLVVFDLISRADTRAAVALGRNDLAKCGVQNDSTDLLRETSVLNYRAASTCCCMGKPVS